MNTAIDEKSPYTGGHCQRVPQLTMMLAETVSEMNEGPLAWFNMNDKDRYELKIAGLLHDCGKVTTPVHVVDKATKLETIYDRIHIIDTRFEVMKRDAEIELLKEKTLLVAHGAARAEHDAADARFRERLRRWTTTGPSCAPATSAARPCANRPGTRQGDLALSLDRHLRPRGELSQRG